MTWATLVCLAALLAAAALLVTYRGSTYILYDPTRKPHVGDPSRFGLGFEPVRFKNRDGLELRGWIVPAKAPKDPRRTVVLFHGWGTNKAFIFESTRFLADRGGCDCFYFDTRGCGESAGAIGTIGYLETFDSDAAFDFLRKSRPAMLGRLGVWGRSMGGAVAVVAATRHPEIRCGVIETAFTSYEEVGERWSLHKTGVPRFPLLDLTYWWIRRRVGGDPEDMSPIRHVSKLDGKPMFYIAGEKDWLMPVSEAEKLHELTKGPKELWVIPGADHDRCWETAPEEYERRTLAFYDRHL